MTDIRAFARCGRAASLAVSALVLQGNIGQTTNLDARLLAAHNRERAEAGVPPLEWDDGLAASAAQWAAHLASVGQLEHYSDDPDAADPEGENLWLGSRGYFTPEQMVGDWIDEKKDFEQGVFPGNSRTGSVEDIGHYTQVIWRSTGRVGCAVARGREDDILVCRYLEAGNVIGERPF